jgi:hypothetical protein
MTASEIAAQGSDAHHLYLVNIKIKSTFMLLI